MPAKTVFEGTGAVRAAVGQHLGYSDWLEIDQERVNLFADATGDHQWIHVDVERAKAESPFGGPVAHGYLTLSLVSYFMPQIVSVQGISLGINYGLNKVRFPAPVPVGSRIRAGGQLAEATDIDGGVQVTVVVTVEREGSDKPVCVAESLSRFMD
jgi:acyl dehydratase